MTPVNESSRHKGRLGEQRAVDFLTGAGYRVIARNFRTRRGEIDIVAQRDNTLVFVEVKCWNAIDITDLEISISRRKQRRIIDASQVFMMRMGLTDRYDVRFDLIFVKGDSMEVQHVQEAFTESTWSG